MSEFDEEKANKVMDQYSRQIGSIGLEAMKKLTELDVLVVGMKGTGVEVAKDIALLGARSVTIADDDTVEIADLGTNYWLKESDVGKVSRARACVEQLVELNEYCTITCHEGDISDEMIRRFGAVIVTKELPLATLQQWGDVCHERKATVKVTEGGVESEKEVPRPGLFILALTSGLCGSIFVDIGNGSVDPDGNPAHMVTDVNGEAPITNVVDYITAVQGDGCFELTVTVSATQHGFGDNDLVSFNEVKIPELCGDGEQKPTFRVGRVYAKRTDDKGNTREVLVANKFKITVPSLASLEDYKDGGFVTEVKEPEWFPFDPLSASIESPLHSYNDHPMMPGEAMFPYPDMELAFMENRGAQLHIARRALWEFQAQKGRLPALHSEDDAAEMVSMAKALVDSARSAHDAAYKAWQDAQSAVSAAEGDAAKAEAKAAEAKANAALVKAPLVVGEVNASVIRKVAMYARTELPSYCAVLAGIAAQEAVKCCGRYTPVRQWMHFDEFRLVDEQPAADAQPQGTRYDHQLAVFGRAIQDKIEAQKWFLVGCGALGCEYLKAMALMGLGSNGGYVVVTDNDHIEVSNLNRQFLFRKNNVGQPKSECGAAAARAMNPSMKIKPLKDKVCPDTEATVFTYNFWSDLDGVWNALDNVKARQYTDSKIVFHEKPLLESGTLGTKANSETIIPHKTKSYNDYVEQTMDNAVPMCTLRNFPHLIEHCIEWARAEFTDTFEVLPQDANKLVSDPKAFIADLEKKTKSEAVQLSKLRDIAHYLGVRREQNSFAGCMQLAMDYFLHQFRNRINDLTHMLPRDYMKKDENGQERPFWTGSHRFPNTANFDVEDEHHVRFIFHAANLYAFMFNTEGEADFDKFWATLRSANLNVPEWVPPKKISSAEELEKDEADDKADAEAKAQLAALKKQLQETDFGALKESGFQVADFEKDDDSNFHIDFIASASNMRAWNYNINAASRFKVKMIAGRITPALATTTAMITGVVVNEFYKLMVGRGLTLGSNVNLALGTFQLFEMEPPKKAQKFWDPMEGMDVIPVPQGWDTWDKVVVEATKETTVAEFVAAIPKAHHDCACTMLLKKGEKKFLYNELAQGSERERLQGLKSTPLFEAISSLYGEPGGEFVRLDPSCELPDGDLASIPPLYVRFV